MGRAEGGNTETLGFVMPITDTEERKILLWVLQPRPEVSFAAVSRRSPRGALEIVVSLAEGESLLYLEDQLAEALDNEVTVRTLAEVQADPLLLAEMLDGQLLFDRSDRWAKLQESKEEVSADAAEAAADLSERAWDALESIKHS